jgi:hypothetical protein
MHVWLNIKSILVSVLHTQFKRGRLIEPEPKVVGKYDSEELEWLKK